MFIVFLFFIMHPMGCLSINSKKFTISKWDGYSEGTVLQTTNHTTIASCTKRCLNQPACKDFAITHNDEDEKHCMLFKSNQLCKIQDGAETLIKYYEEAKNDSVTEINVRGPATKYLSPPSSTVDWDKECSGICKHYVLVGMGRGVVFRGEGVVAKLDFILCAGISTALLTDKASAETVTITNTMQQCSENKVVTALFGLDRAWLYVVGFKCKLLMNNWKVNYGDCETISIVQRDMVLRCSEGTPFYVMIAMWRRGDENGMTYVKCCRIIKLSPNNSKQTSISSMN